MIADSYFARARMDTNPDRRAGLGFWLESEAERSLRKKHLSDVQMLAGRKVGEDDFHIRGMLVCNTQRDYYYSRFSRAALGEIAELMPGSPAMYAHDYGSQPVGRFFASRTVRIEDPDLPPAEQWWNESLYYVPRDGAGDAHVNRVDLGIYKEVSLGWRVAGQDCSVCGDSIYRCAHIPGDIYEKRGICEYEFSGITSVLEVSHVFRGGQKDTSTFVPGADAAEPVAGAAAMRSFAPGSRDIDPALLIAAKRHNGRIARTNGMTLEQWLACADGQRAVGIGAFFFGQVGERGNTQSVNVRKDRFSTVERARRWVRDHDFRADRMKTDAEYHRFEQSSEARFTGDGFRAIKLENGIEARVGKPAPQQSMGGQMNGRSSDGGVDPLAEWLSADSHS